MNILFIGSGAVGSYFAGKLSQTGAAVSLQARSDYEHVKIHGVHIHSVDGDFHYQPRHVVRDAAELPAKPDYAVLCIKVVEGADRVALLKNAVGPDTAIVLLSNGIEIEPEIAQAYPDHEIISALAFIGVTRTAPGHVHHQAYGHLSLGSYPSGLSDKARWLSEAFQSAGVLCNADADIATARWQKCVWNAAFNPVSVLTGLDTGRILNGQEGLIRALMQEVVAIAAAVGHPLPDTLVDKSIHGTKKMAAYKTSMLVDLEAGQPLETEVILGNAVRAGHKAGVPIPHLETVYALLKLKEAQRDRCSEVMSVSNQNAGNRLHTPFRPGA
ncbi:MAG: 2-dehydropantoate 2-reductase [Methylococcaceae bacterium]|nr:MAG: 2-dehydropantoate 2-reductase [Methylococcaceae bacterium]